MGRRKPLLRNHYVGYSPKPGDASLLVDFINAIVNFRPVAHMRRRHIQHEFSLPYGADGVRFNEQGVYFI